MKCGLPKIKLKGGETVSPCDVQEQVIDRLRAENAGLKRRNQTLQRMVDYARKHHPPTAKEQAAQDAETVFRPAVKQEET